MSSTNFIISRLFIEIVELVKEFFSACSNGGKMVMKDRERTPNDTNKYLVEMKLEMKLRFLGLNKSCVKLLVEIFIQRNILWFVFEINFICWKVKALNMKKIYEFVLNVRKAKFLELAENKRISKEHFRFIL